MSGSGSGSPSSPNSRSTLPSLLTFPSIASSLTMAIDSTQNMDLHTSPPTRCMCSEWCSCICHRKSSFRSPWILRSMFGDVFVDYSTPGLACNECRCRRQTISSLRMTFHLPRYLIHRYISMGCRYTPLEGAAFSIRVPRVMPWGHLLWNYADHGNIIAVQGLFSMGKSSPYDTNLYGSNAFIYEATHGYGRLGQFLVQ